MSSSKYTREELIAKIKKLHIEAERLQTIGDVAAAETFLANIQMLLMKYQIDMSEVENHNPDDDVITKTGDRKDGVEYYMTPSEGLWEADLITVIAKHNFCEAVLNTAYHAKRYIDAKIYPYAHIIGTKENIEIVKYLIDICRPMFRRLAIAEYDKSVISARNTFKVEAVSKRHARFTMIGLIDAKITEMEAELAYGFLLSKGALEDVKIKLQRLKVLQKNFVKAVDDDFMPSDYSDRMKDQKQIYFLKNLNKFGILADRGTFIRSFLLGTSIGLHRKLETQKREFEQQEPEQAKKFNELVLVKKNEVGEFLKKNFSNLGSFNTSKPADPTGFSAGVQAGKNAQLNKGLNRGDGNKGNLLN